MQMSPPSICSPVTIGDNSRIIPAGDICCLKLICKPDFHRTIGRERRERVSQLAWCGEGCFDSRRRVNSNVMPLVHQENIARVYRAGFAWTILCLVVIFRRAVMTDPSTGV